jgi:hypothetical protein
MSCAVISEVWEVGLWWVVKAARRKDATDGGGEAVESKRKIRTPLNDVAYKFYEIFVIFDLENI